MIGNDEQTQAQFLVHLLIITRFKNLDSKSLGLSVPIIGIEVSASEINTVDH